jgi:hypothetical protein
MAKAFRTLPSRDVEVVADAEIVVCGGGPAGIAAAVAAARFGRSALLIEQLGCLGGLGTAGMVPVFCPSTDGEKVIARGICKEVIDELARRMGVPVNYDWFPIDYEILKLIYDELVLDSGAQLLLATTLVDVATEASTVEAVVVGTRTGLKAITGRVFIDCTGDGNVSDWAGAPYAIGGEAAELMGPTLCSTFSNVNWGQYDAAVKAGRSARSIWLSLMAEGQAPLPEWHFVGAMKAGPTRSGNNLGHTYGVVGIAEQSLTEGYVEGRRLARVYLEFFREHVPGFENAELSATAELLGVRETRRVMGDYVLSFEDYKARASFPDEIGRFAYPVDIHSATTDPEAQKRVEEELRETRLGKGESYGIPYRSLIAQKLSNLLVAGRCMSADRQVQSSIRVMPGCFVTGQAAGAAAALAVEGTTTIRDIDTRRLREVLRSQDAYIP